MQNNSSFKAASGFKFPVEKLSDLAFLLFTEKKLREKSFIKQRNVWCTMNSKSSRKPNSEESKKINF